MLGRTLSKVSEPELTIVAVYAFTFAVIVFVIIANWPTRPLLPRPRDRTLTRRSRARLPDVPLADRGDHPDRMRR